MIRLFAAFSESVPLVPFNEDQEMALNSSTYLSFLQELDISLPQSVGQLYPRVPISLDYESIYERCVQIAHFSELGSQSLLNMI
jgi:hypothetical protein